MTSEGEGTPASVFKVQGSAAFPTEMEEYTILKQLAVMRATFPDCFRPCLGDAVPSDACRGHFCLLHIMQQ